VASIGAESVAGLNLAVAVIFIGKDAFIRRNRAYWLTVGVIDHDVSEGCGSWPIAAISPANHPQASRIATAEVVPCLRESASEALEGLRIRHVQLYSPCRDSIWNKVFK
jgi:hypothetical protein